MSEQAHWHVVWDEKLEGRALRIERNDENQFHRVRAEQDAHDEGIAYQQGDEYVHISPSSEGEPVEGEASSRAALREALKEMHFSADAVARVLSAIDEG